MLLSVTAGPYETYQGSPVSRGELQHDMWGVAAPRCANTRMMLAPASVAQSPAQLRLIIGATKSEPRLSQSH